MIYATDLEMSGKEEMITTGNGVPYSKTNAMDQEKKLLEPLAYLLQVPGKNIRKKLLHAFNFWMKVDDAKVHEIGEIVQMLHNASLLVDDIEDNSILRRGIPVAHKVLNFSLTIPKQYRQCSIVSEYSSSKPQMNVASDLRGGKYDQLRQLRHVHRARTGPRA